MIGVDGCGILRWIAEKNEGTFRAPDDEERGFDEADGVFLRAAIGAGTEGGEVPSFGFRVSSFELKDHG
jgi:hypothetical protein